MLDADIRDFFGQLDRDWLGRFLRHRIADERVLRLIGKWLAAGVIEDGTWAETSRGSPQGASVPPLLANVYLHYVLDLWADWWRRQFAHGDVIIIRFADDFIVGFEHRHDAERFRDELGSRVARFGLELHPDKTRLVEFGRRAARDRAARGEGKPETFTFLGFTHICATSKSGRGVARTVWPAVAGRAAPVRPERAVGGRGVREGLLPAAGAAGRQPGAGLAAAAGAAAVAGGPAAGVPRPCPAGVAGQPAGPAPAAAAASEAAARRRPGEAARGGRHGPGPAGGDVAG